MIITVTPNPGIDRTVTLGSELVRGAVHRVGSVSNEPGGKGVNVARALTLAGLEVIAVLPAASDDPFLTLLGTSGVVAAPVPIAGAVRTNLTITEPDGTTTKLNEPGAPLQGADLSALTAAVVERAATASWVVLSGSLPPGTPDDWYAEVVARLQSRDCKVAVDTSEGAADGTGRGLRPGRARPHQTEFRGTGRADRAIRHGAGIRCPRRRSESCGRRGTRTGTRGVGAVLATLGAAGAVLVDGTGAWFATPPPIVPRSTVGAGDSSLAGYVRADIAGADAPGRLRMAVAYGSAAAQPPGIGAAVTRPPGYRAGSHQHRSHRASPDRSFAT